MFERYTERARRVISFARFEASQFGSPYIETEHLLLGLLREDPNVATLLPETRSLSEIRGEIEKHIDPRERISTSVEIPLSAQCKRALYSAAEEANNMGERHVGTEHLLLGLLRIKDGLAAEILRGDQIDLGKVREKLRDPRHKQCVATASFDAPHSPDLHVAIEVFLAALRDGNLRDLEGFFVSSSCFVDASGKLWRGHHEIVPSLEILLAPFAKRNAKPIGEGHTYASANISVTTLIWEDVHLPGFSPLDLFRMSIVFGGYEGIPIAYLIQITPVGLEAAGKTAAN
jgi:hypothetical protein